MIGFRVDCGTDRQSRLSVRSEGVPRFSGALDNALHNEARHTLANTRIASTPRRTHHLRAIHRYDTLTTEGAQRKLEEEKESINEP